MGSSFFYKLFSSTIGSMPAQYDPEVDTWWGVVLTELGILDPFREEILSYLVLKFLCTVLFALFLWALSLCKAYKRMTEQRDDAREDSKKGAYEYCDLHNKLRDVENELYHSNERLQDVDNGMNDERKEFRDTIQELGDQHLVDEEEIRYLNQEVSNTECDRDEYVRRFEYASQENQKLARENQRLEASLVEKDEMINDLQAYKDDAISEPIATVSPPPIYIQPHDEIELAEKDDRINDLEQQNGTLTSEINELRTDLKKLRDEHGECSGNLHTQLTEKDEEIQVLRTEEKTADEGSAETVADLRTKLTEKDEEVKDLEEANATLVADSERLSTLSDELEVSRSAHAHCDETSTSQNSRIGELETAEQQLEETVQVKSDEIGRLQGQLTSLRHDLEELEERHAICGERADREALQITGLRNENGSLQESIDELSQNLRKARDEHADLIQEGQQVENQYATLSELHTCAKREVRSLQGQVEALKQQVNNQQQQIQTLETNCPQCQKLREALDEVVKDVEMSDDTTRDEMKREITAEVRAELRSQVADDLRRQIRGEVERELREAFRSHYSDVLARNSRRIQEQDRRLLEKDAELENVKNIVNHVACERREANLQSTITTLRQNATIAQGRYSRSNGDAKHDREQLSHAQTTIENLRSELETIKADQRRAQNVNPLQSRLKSLQRELDNMKEDRRKARDNCSIYSKQLSDLRKNYKALENDLAAFREKSSLDGDNMTEDGCTREPGAVQDGKLKVISTLQNEVARLLKELHERKARDNAQDRVMDDHATPLGNESLPAEEGEQQWPEGSFPDDPSSAVPATDGDEATALDLLRHEVDLREARDGKKKAVFIQPTVSAGPTVERSEGSLSQRSAQDFDDEADDKGSLLNDGGEESDDELEEGEILDTKRAVKSASKPARRFGRRRAHLSARQPTTKSVLGGGAGRKREHDEYSDGEADDEGGEDRKKVKITVIEDGMHRLKEPGNISAPAQGDKPQEDKDME